MEVQGYNVANVSETSRVQNRRYETGETAIDVNYKEYLPQGQQDVDPHKAIIFLPGWAMAGSAKALQIINQAYANDSGMRTISVSTFNESVVLGSLAKEAEAVQRLIEEEGIKQVTLVGFSEGGVKALDLAAVLPQSNNGVSVEGLILLSSQGLYEQDQGTLARDLVKDSLLHTPVVAAKDTLQEKRFLKAFPRGTRAAVDILFGMAREMIKGGGSYRDRLQSELQDMADKIR